MNVSGLKRLSFKLPAFVAVMIVIVATGLSGLTYLSSRAYTVENANRQLDLVSEKRQTALKSWYDSYDLTARSLAANPGTLTAMKEFSDNWTFMDEAARAEVRDAYTTGNPNEAGNRDALDIAEGEQWYHAVHARHHDYFRFFNKTNSLYDLFLVDMEGNIVYSVFKESDFGQNVLTGDLAGSGISEVFVLTRDAPKESAHFSSFQPYGPSAGAVASFTGIPVKDGSDLPVGILIFQVNLENFASILQSPEGLGDQADTFMVNGEGRTLVGSKSANGPQALDPVKMTDHIKAALSGETIRTANAVGQTNNPVSAIATPITFDGERYALVVEWANTAIFADLNAQRNTLILLSVLAAGILSMISWLFIRTITSSLNGLGQQMGRVADGDYSVEVTSTRRDDEIGDIGRKLVEFSNKLAIAAQHERDRKEDQVHQDEVLEALRDGLIRLADGNLSQPINKQFKAQYESIRADFNETLRTLSEAISNVIQAAGSIKHGANEISQASDELSNRTENQAATLEQTAAALDELTASVKSAADGAKSVESIVVEAQSEAEQSGKIVGDAIAAMTEIEKSSEHISQIIGVIDDIAFQTNLLALNAGVEAARAGEAGKGFAVVASEVRALAQRSSEAAKEIKALISGSAKQVERGVDLVGGAGKALGSIVERVTHISDLIRSMANGSSEQAIGLGEINIGVNQLDQVTQQNAAMVEEATAASHVLKNDAETLRELVSRFVTGNTDTTVDKTPHYQGSSKSQVVQFQPAIDTAMIPKPVPIAVNAKGAGRMNDTSSDGDWLDF